MFSSSRTTSWWSLFRRRVWHLCRRFRLEKAATVRLGYCFPSYRSPTDFCSSLLQCSLDHTAIRRPRRCRETEENGWCRLLVVVRHVPRPSFYSFLPVLTLSRSLFYSQPRPSSTTIISRCSSRASSLKEGRTEKRGRRLWKWSLAFHLCFVVLLLYD